MAGNIQDRSTFGWVSVDTDGQSVSPAYQFESERSLGFYRSAASHIAMPSTATFVSRFSALGTPQFDGADFTGGTTSLGTSTFSGTVTIASSGYTGTVINAMSFTTCAMPAFVVQGSMSSSTVFVWPAARIGDFILVAPDNNPGVSSISSGLIFHSHCTQAGQVELRISNVSTLVQNQSAQTLRWLRISAS